MRRSCWFLVAALAIAGCGPRGTPDPVRVEDPWIAAAPPTARVLAAYATLRNESDATVVIERVLAPGFEEAELHDMGRNPDGSMRMRALGAATLAPGERLELAPGGTHLMLIAPKRPMPVGEKVQVAFVLATGKRVEAWFEVRER